jgi:hypothetical protein
MILTANLHLGRQQSVAFKHMKIRHAANAAWCMTLMLVVPNAAGCTPHAPILFFMKPPKLLQV